MKKKKNVFGGYKDLVFSSSDFGIKLSRFVQVL